MSALALSAIIFVLTLGGIFLGTLLRRALPKHHLDDDAKDVVRLGVGLIATIAALVLGLLIAAAKSSFDTQSTHVAAGLSASPQPAPSHPLKESQQHRHAEIRPITREHM